MGLVTMLDERKRRAAAAVANPQEPAQQPSKIDETLKGLPDASEPKPALKVADRSGSKAADSAPSKEVDTAELHSDTFGLVIDEYTFIFDSQMPLDLDVDKASSEGVASKGIRIGEKKASSAARKPEEKIINTKVKGKEKAPEGVAARPQKGQVRKVTSSKAVALKPCSIRFPVEPLEVVPLQSFDPMLDVRTHQEYLKIHAEISKTLAGGSAEPTPSLPIMMTPKPEPSSSKAELERKRMLDLENRLAREFAVEQQRERDAQMKRKIEAEKKEKEEKNEEGEIEESLKPEEQVVVETILSLSDLPESADLISSRKTEKKENKQEEKKKKKKKGEMKRKRETDEKEEEVKRSRMEEEEEKKEEKKKEMEKQEKEFRVAEAQLLKEKEILTGGRPLSAAGEEILHQQAADRATAINLIKSGKISLTDRPESSIPIFIRPRSPIRRHTSVIIETDDILLSHAELKRRRKEGDRLQKKQLEKLNLERLRGSDRIMLGEASESLAARSGFPDHLTFLLPNTNIFLTLTQLSYSDRASSILIAVDPADVVADELNKASLASSESKVSAPPSNPSEAVRDELNKAGLSSPDPSIPPPPPELSTPSRRMLDAFQDQVASLEARLMDHDKRAAAREEELSRELGVALKKAEERRVQGLADRTARKKAEDRVVELEKKLYLAQNDAAHYMKKSDHYLKILEDFEQSRRAVSHGPSTSNQPVQASDESRNYASRVERDAHDIQMMSIDATHGLSVLISALNKIQIRAAHIGKEREKDREREREKEREKRP